MADDPAPLLARSGQESGHVLERHERDLKRVAEAHEARALDARVDVETAGEDAGLVADDPDRPAVQPREADDDVPGEVLVHLEEVAVVHHQAHELLHVVGLVGGLGHDRRQGGLPPVDRVRARPARRILGPVARHERQQPLDVPDRVGVVARGKVRHAALRVVRERAAQVLHRHVFARHRLDHLGPGHEHVARALDHDREVGDRGRVHGPACTRAQDRRDLGHDPRGQRVAQEHVGVCAERGTAYEQYDPEAHFGRTAALEIRPPYLGSDVLPRGCKGGVPSSAGLAARGRPLRAAPAPWRRSARRSRLPRPPGWCRPARSRLAAPSSRADRGPSAGWRA